MKQNNIKTKNNLIYGVNDNPNLLTKILLGFNIYLQPLEE